MARALSDKMIFRLPKTMKLEAERLARKRGRSSGAIAREALREYLDRQNGANPE